MFECRGRCDRHGWRKVEQRRSSCRDAHDCMDAGGTTTGTWEVEHRRERVPRATPGAVAEERPRAGRCSTCLRRVERGRQSSRVFGRWWKCSLFWLNADSYGSFSVLLARYEASV